MFKNFRSLVVVLTLVGTMSTVATAGPLGGRGLVARLLPGKNVARGNNQPFNSDRPTVQQPVVETQPQAVASFQPTTPTETIRPTPLASGYEPAATSPLATAPLAGGEPDLVLEDVALAAGPTRIAGPAYAVRFCNQGLQATGKFYVAVFASLEPRPSAEAPRAMVEVPGLAAGEAREVVLRLPATALHLGPQDVEFTHLIILVDATNAIEELDESNNVAAIDRASLEQRR